MIKNRKEMFLQYCPMDINVYIQHHKNMLFSHTNSFTGNYRLFAHNDVCYRFNLENDNVVLEDDNFGIIFKHLKYCSFPKFSVILKIYSKHFKIRTNMYYHGEMPPKDVYKIANIARSYYYTNTPMQYTALLYTL